MQLETLTLAQIKHLAKYPSVWFVTIARILSALAIFVNPFWGLVATFIFDILDGQILLYHVRVSMEEYEAYDKPLDWVTYLCELWVGAQYGMFLPLFLLLFYRFMGQFMYMRTRKRFFFALFPNFFEFSFLWLIIVTPFGSVFDWSSPQPWGYLAVLLIVKQGQDFIMHYFWDIHIRDTWDKLIGNRIPNLHSV